MLTSIIAFSIFITNPTGTLGPHPVSRSPYFFYEESQMREYKTQAECDAVAKKIREELSQKTDELFRVANTAQKSTEVRIQKAKYESIQCLKVERDIETADSNTYEVNKPLVSQQAAVSQVAQVPAKTNTAYRIGRLDENNGFHGTVYDERPYASMDVCKQAFENASVSVSISGQRGGATKEQQAEMVKIFTNKYNCFKVIVDNAPVKETPPATIVQTPPEVINMPQNAPNVQSGSYVPNGQTIVQNAPVQNYSPVQGTMVLMASMPTKPYYITEMVRQHNGGVLRMYYPGTFPSAVMCYQALGGLLKDQENMIRQQYHLNPNHYSYQQMSANLTVLHHKRTSMGCVT